MTDLAELVPDIQVAPPRRGIAIVRWMGVAGFLAAVAWFAHFSQWRQFGFYSDDHTFAVPPMAWSAAQSNRNIHELLFSYPEPQGRPLGWLLGTELAYFSYHAGGVFGLFALGWAILAVNGVLAYALFARRLPGPLPLVAALMYLLFPADTTRPYLCHAHVLQPSLTFSLIAAHLLLARQMRARLLAYPFVALSLLTYESAILPLLALPLLDWPTGNRRRWCRQYAIHLTLLVGMVGVIAITRTHGGEVRAAEAAGSKPTIVAHIILATLRGPLYVAHACVRRPLQQLLAIVHRPAHALPILGAMVAFAGALLAVRSRACPTRSTVRRAAAFGVLAIGVSYLFSFTHYPPSCEEGQSTSVHLSAVIGASALAAALAGWVARQRSGRWVAGIGAVYFGLVFGWSLDEQAAFGTVWREEQQFWRDVVRLCPDMTDSTVILCDGTMPQPTWVMPVNLWHDVMVPNHLFRFPSSFRLPPVLMAYPRLPGQDWASTVEWTPAGHLHWQTPPCACGAQVMAEGNTILLHVDDAGQVSRVSGTIQIQGKSFQLRPLPPPGSRVPYPTLPFYDLLIGN